MPPRSQLIVSLAMLATACGGASAPPSQGGSGQVVTGTERIQWDQAAADAGELATFRYAIYLDDVRAEASNASCGSSTTGGRFTCTANLPQMSPGNHVLQLAAFVLDGAVIRESSRSTTIRIIKQ
jgi:hypothetical protein